MADICAYPGCGRRLQAENRSGVCRKHNHSRYCTCAQCAERDPDKRIARAREEEAREAKRRSGHVTLPPMPWATT